MYLPVLLPDLVRRELSIDDILALIASKHEITTQDIQDIFKLDITTTHKVLDFLTRFDFVKLKRQYVVLNETMKSLFD
ncbi:MAG: hypothetical protein AUH84_03245 [Thaumarchaeota archaeon 13_1_40CM_4_38_7]|nr:MAG: hypothetical protein AUH84_03245 [Thaumarchaeota archaeon 13_1_40CM_4_38_7]